MGVLAITPTGLGASANIAAVQSLTTHLTAKFQVLVDPIAAMNGTTVYHVPVFEIDSDGLGTGTNSKMAVYFEAFTPGTFRLTMHIPGQGTVLTPNITIATANLPASGQNNYIVGYVQFDGSTDTHIVSVFLPGGTLITDGTNTATFTSSANFGTLINPAGNGRVVINQEQYSAGTLQGETFDGLAIYSQNITGSAQYSVPAVGDTGIVALWDFDDAGSPTSAAAQVGGQALVLTASQYTWYNVGGTWLSSGGFAVPNAPVTSATLVGNFSVSGGSGGGSTGGLATFTASGLGVLASSNVTIQALTKIGFKMRFLVDLFGTIPGTFGTLGLWQIDDGTNGNAKMSGYIGNDGTGSSYATGHSKIGYGVPGVDTNVASGVVANSSLPAFGAGNYVEAYWWWDNPNGTHGVTLYDSLGNVLITQTLAGNYGNLPVITGNGILRVNAGQLGTSGAMTIDGCVVYNQNVATAYQWGIPALSDPGVVAIYRFDEQTGTTTADDLGGPVMNLTNFTWGAGGQWFASNVLAVPVTGVTSASAIASPASGVGDTTGFIAYSNAVAVAIPNAPVTSPAQVQGVGEIDSTVYTGGVSSTTAVGTIAVVQSFGPSVTGVVSATAVGAFTVAVVQPLQALPNATCQYILDMAIAFNTLNTGPTAPAVIANTPMILERIRSDQRGIFSKLADRNRTYFLQVVPFTTTSAASGRVFDMSTLAVPVERPIQIVLNDGRVVSIVDILDLSAELAPRCYVIGTQLVEVLNDYSPVTGPISGTLYYVQAPVDINTAGTLAQTVSIPTDWTDLLIIPLAQFLAASDVSASPAGQPSPRTDEVQALQTLFDDRLQTFLQFLSHQPGQAAMRLEVPLPLSVPR